MASNPEVVVVTGASAGVGRAIVREFARQGARVGLISREEGRLQDAAWEVSALGGEALVLPCDVSDSHAVEQAAAKVAQRWGHIDVWVNCAMVTVFAPVMETTASEYRRVMDVTFLGFVHGTQSALRRMRPRGRGTVVQVGSALAFRGIPLQSAYCSAKHALIGFTESLRCELRHDKSPLHITTVDLPGMNTPQFDWSRSKMPRQAQPVPPIYQPEVAARAVVWAAHHQRRSIWVGIPTVKTIIGNRLVPGWLDRYLARVGYTKQMSDEPRDTHRPDNLLTPVPGDPGAHGRFDARARRHSVQLWANLHRAWLAAAAVVGVTSAAALGARHRG
ncbi:SDR family oxidoreductase [Myxococcus stipitatus]|uniref:SDR family oxidoreductase n=1 Tax=Myxococcus stipitatus TaxID=83455 RepID=UPI0030D129C3